MDERVRAPDMSELSEACHVDRKSSSCSRTSIENPNYDGPQELPQRSLAVPGVEIKHRTTRFKVQTNEKQSRNPCTEVVVIAFDVGYLATCGGILSILQIVFSLATLICLVTSGREESGLLNLPLTWHFRIMMFVLVLTILYSTVSVVGNITSLVYMFPFEWTFINLVVYSVFAFLYLVGTSLVASAFDFYNKMKSDVTAQTIQQLVICVVLGYICMVIYGSTALVNYRHWRLRYRLYHRRQLLEEDEIDI
ncbi:uncharacterized protein LOC121387953 [Gigantopelta aegis]|uniref:uncharacterized protein LOC121387953 n=1 Tax=Gigantopelta aegis TaxID=1735272 RepID=UPI001B88E43D|nr:uncharacterized protein LOC121387953 [Gigantopelta aegis]